MMGLAGLDGECPHDTTQLPPKRPAFCRSVVLILSIADGSSRGMQVSQLHVAACGAGAAGAGAGAAAGRLASISSSTRVSALGCIMASPCLSV